MNVFYFGIGKIAAKHGFDDVVMAFAEFERRQLSADAGDAALTSKMSTQDYLLLKTRADEAFRAGLHSAAQASSESRIDSQVETGTASSQLAPDSRIGGAFPEQPSSRDTRGILLQQSPARPSVLVESAAVASN